MNIRSSHSFDLSLLACLAAATDVAMAQQPHLDVFGRSLSRQLASTAVQLQITTRPNDVYVLLADPLAGHTSLLGASFDLAFSPGLFPLRAGVAGLAPILELLAVQPALLPNGAQLFLQFGSFAPSQGLASLLVSNVESLGVYDGAPYALTYSFENFQSWPEPITGGFDAAVTTRLQALPPTTRTVHPLPPQAWPAPVAAGWQPLHPSGARFQLAFRAADLGANGSPEQLTAVRWRPLFGQVTAETYPQFSLLAAHSDVVPDYRTSPQTGLPLFPASGLASAFASNVRAGTVPVPIYSGAYVIQPQQLLPSGYLPFPALQQAFAYDGQSTLLLETQCDPRPGLGAPANFQVQYRTSYGLVALPGAMNYASAGLHGQPNPLSPAAATQGTPDAALYDWELEFARTTSVAVLPWSIGASPQLDYHDALVLGYTPAGTSIQVEYRGRNGTPASTTPWSTSANIADGRAEIQMRITMVANASTGAVPWIDTLIVPVQ